MANKTERANSSFKAEDRASAADRRDRQIFADLEKSRIESDAKTLRLKALRLEKEAAEAAGDIQEALAQERMAEALTAAAREMDADVERAWS